MADQLTTDLGAPLRDLERAQLYYQSAQPDQAQQLVAGLPEDWKRSQRVDTLAKQVTQGSQFLADAKALGQADVLDPGFEDRLDVLLRTTSRRATWPHRDWPTN